jgi:SRSO17 transposase
MWTTEDQTVAAGHSVTPASWQAGLDELLGRVAGRFARVEPRRRASAFVLGLLADLPRKNCWTIAEHAGDTSPDGMQHLLAGAIWDHDAVRDDIRDWLVEYLGDPGAVLVVDETGDLKKGTHTVGVQRQYTGTAGKVDNAQVAVYLAYATTAGHGVIDRELYLPQGWLDDPARLKAAGVPDRVEFATKPQLARMMLERALDAGVPAGWVTADEVYGGSPALRGWLETRQLPYVLAVKATEPLPPASVSGPPTAAARLAEQIPPECWLRISAGQGAKGRRWYAWSRVALSTADAPAGWERWLLVRRSLRTGELAYYVCAGPAGLPLVALARVAGSRWRVEEAFQAGKGLCGLDQHQVRRWRCWYRWVTLAMLAHAFLVVAAVTEHAQRPAPPGAVELTCNEIQHLFAALVATPVADRGHRLRWSWWRRRRQARARACHYRRQAAQQP